MTGDDLARDAPAYRVWCEDCDLDETFREDEPPARDLAYYDTPEIAKRNWSARSAARGRYDNHRMSEFRDYDEGLRHRPHIEALDE